MEWEEFLEKGLGQLNCADLGTLVQRESILAAFYRPLKEPQRFMPDLNGGAVFVGSSYANARALKKMITPQHTNAYFDYLHQKLTAYRHLIERNRQQSPSYTRPTFDVEQARELVQEALRESFPAVKGSYRAK